MPTEEIIFDDDNLQQPNPGWNSSEWIGCGWIYRDVSEYVALEAMRARQIPAAFTSTLPSELLSPAGLYTCSTLPLWNPDCDALESPRVGVDFDATEPLFSPEKPLDWDVLPFSTIQWLEMDFSQAWIDGKRSIRDARDPGHVRFLPLWAVTYMSTLRQIVHCWSQWRAAIFWVMEERDNEEPDEATWKERTLNLLSSIVGETWPTHDLAYLGSTTYQPDQHTDGPHILIRRRDAPLFFAIVGMSP
ncbi:hypothetical protein DFH07DRAFT_950919 [Mycena maculata]|uniref:Uncharacterized protein n=1 Tax=Mycena maculata TaxID=230809 RepID=A0AAD7NWE0_9AGAR|nr:hypothetical protein DFH07DRAFT_950919 [Mycena maculata]